MTGEIEEHVLEVRLLPRYRLREAAPKQLRDQRVRWIQCDDPSGVHDPHAIAEDLCLVQVVRREENGRAALSDVTDEIPEVPARLRVKAGRRLVEEEHLRLVHHRDRDRETLPLPTRELLRLLPCPILEPDRAQERHRIDPAAVEQREQVDDLPREEVLGERALLELHADPLLHAGGLLPDIDTGDERGAAVRLAQPFEDLDRRGLPRPVRTEEREDLALLHVEAHAVDRLDPTVALAQLANGDDRRHTSTITATPRTRAVSCAASGPDGGCSTASGDHGLTNGARQRAVITV